MTYYTSKNVCPIKKHSFVFKNCWLWTPCYWLTCGTLRTKFIPREKTPSIKYYDSPNACENDWFIITILRWTLEVIFDFGLHDVPWPFHIWWSVATTPTPFATKTIKTPNKPLTVMATIHPKTGEQQTANTLSRTTSNTSPAQRTMAYRLHVQSLLKDRSMSYRHMKLQTHWALSVRRQCYQDDWSSFEAKQRQAMYYKRNI
jgi:hypothetical protein